jgi:L-amino acid N-acyltransferase YncA
MQVETGERNGRRCEIGPRTGPSAPDETIAVRRDGVVVGRCSCWWRHTPRHAGARTGFIGHYTANDAVAGTKLLSDACDILARAGCEIAIGPIDGSTWHSYRFIVDRGAEPTFFLEPDSPAEWPGHWTALGFSPLATYTSALTERLDLEPVAIPRAMRRLAAAGISIRSLDVSRIDDELRRLFALSEKSFRRNFLYSPIGVDEFHQQYAALMPAVRPELVLLAERADSLVGFVLAVPDVLQCRRTGSTDTVVVKTIAVHPNVAGAGLAGALVARVHRRAYELGYSRAIHALMHDSNASRRISDRFARPFRRYALFAKALEPAALHRDRGGTV